MKSPLSHSATGQSGGFSLVVTITMMILLSLIAVGLLSLSSITIRDSQAGQAEALAKSNARLALALAIGDLQKHLGSDRSATAQSSLINAQSTEPNLVGAWETYHWDPEQGGSPDYTQKKQNFRKWLVSAPMSKAENLDFPSAPLDAPIRLSSPTPSVSGSAPLRASLVPINDSEGVLTGGYAYTVVDNSMRVPINIEEQEPENIGELIAHRSAPARSRVETLVTELDPDSRGDLHKINTLETLGLIMDESTFEENKEHLTAHSLTLLTNPIDGGFKKDLTTAFEDDGNGIDFKQTFGSDSLYYQPNDGAPTWAYLKDHYQHYRSFSDVAGGTPKYTFSRNELRGSARGTDPSPEEETLLPVIAKMQIIFSLVAHEALNVDNRRQTLDTKAIPRGYRNYGCPNLVYDPVITLYNPYDVALQLDQLRIRVWDPPVAFGFKKNEVYLRSEHNDGDYHGIARFQIANQSDPDARKWFTFVLREMRGRNPGNPLTLEPGEVKVFSPWVENNWSWQLETSGGYSPRAFFDWNAGRELGNKDNRTNNQMGVETVPGWDVRAGLQTDHLAISGKRPPGTIYPWERGTGFDGAGWLAIHLNDTFGVTAKAQRTITERNSPDFQVDLLAGRDPTAERDVLRSYKFRFGDVSSEISTDDSTDEIERTFRVRDLMQRDTDRSAGGKSPFATLTMTAKTTSDSSDYSKPWVYSHPVVSGADQDTTRVGNALDTYDLRFEEVQDFNTLPGVELNPTTNQSFYGASSSSHGGSTHVPMFKVPVVPASSLGSLLHSNLDPSSTLPRVPRPLGSSWAHPLLPSNGISTQLSGTNLDQNTHGSGILLDHSYLINDALWDRTFFSTAASFDSPLLDPLNRANLLEDFFQGNTRLLNPRLTPISSKEYASTDLAEELDQLSESEFMNRIGGTMAIRGGFNINTDSKAAWQAVLTSLRDQEVAAWGGNTFGSSGRTSFPRHGFSLVDDQGSNEGITPIGIAEWAGYRSLDDDDIDTLATNIVNQLRLRGDEDQAPNMTVAEFVNRRITREGDLHSLKGILESAIEASGFNQGALDDYSKSISEASTPPTMIRGVAHGQAYNGETAEGAPPMLSQSDLLAPLAAIMTTRGDTFRIRAYGEARNGKNAPIARAWCEAVIQRTPDYLDPSDQPHLREDELQSETNVKFGRRFIVTSFRWLSSEEV
ncbi:hypothetical protein [Roseibacillus persicicus]|nr:hypothetical protein [Roseibacillus persicicus]